MRRNSRPTGGLRLSPPDPRPAGGRRLRPPGPWLALLGLGLALALGACGGTPDGDRVASLSGAGATSTTNGTGKAAADKDPQQAALDFARCMRQHGIEMPDPEVDDRGRVKMRIGAGASGSRPDPKKLEAAQQACGNLLGGGDGDRQIDPAERDAMVAFARCMRQHGIDMPDPTGDGLVMRRDGERGPDPESEEFQAAERACDHHLSNLRRPGAESGGGS
jgi:hypothetical protein